jgi:type VI secretion system protein ImpF
MSRIRPNQLLLPSVFDRLIDFEPEVSVETPKSRNQLLRDLKQSVRRDLECLLNTRICLFPIPDDMVQLKKSVLNYGIPDFTSLTMGNRENRERLRQLVEETIRRFETRFQSVRVEIAEDFDLRKRTLRFRIDGILHAEPAPEPVIFDSELRPQSCDFEVRSES